MLSIRHYYVSSAHQRILKGLWVARNARILHWDISRLHRPTVVTSVQGPWSVGRGIQLPMTSSSSDEQQTNWRWRWRIVGGRVRNAVLNAIVTGVSGAAQSSCALTYIDDLHHLCFFISVASLFSLFFYLPIRLFIVRIILTIYSDGYSVCSAVLLNFFPRIFVTWHWHHRITSWRTIDRGDCSKHCEQCYLLIGCFRIV